MKELSIEEKAKAYDNLIERLKDLKFAYRFSPLSDTIEEKFPELKESEHERIRKEILEYFHQFDNVELRGAKISDWISWLEKQDPKKHKEELEKAYKTADEVQYKKGYEAAKREFEKQGEQKPVNTDYISGVRKELLGIEDNAKNINGLTESQWVAIRAAHRLLGEYITKEQKLAEWSEEDKMQLDSAIHLVSSTGHVGTTNWLKSLKDRVHPKQEWSEEDKNALKVVTDVFEQYGVHLLNYPAFMHWIKTLPERISFNTYWKPSDEQMEALNNINVIGSINYAGQGQELINLYNDLKKLREE